MEQREIKFRLFGNGKMFEPFTLDNDFDCLTGWMTDRILMQYTGLKDKNGVEIYEGDIIECDNEKHLISWNNEQSGFWPFTTRIGNLYERIRLGFEVIGNIYENPELLK